MRPAAGAALLLLLSISRSAGAQQLAGDGIEALPAVVRVPMAGYADRGVAFSGAAAYGYTESLIDGHDQHHRAAGVFAISGRVTDWLALGIRLDGRYDSHETAAGNDDGWVGEPRVLLRAGTRVAQSFGIGLQTTLWMPSQRVPSIDFNAASVELEALGSFTPPRSALRLAIEAGFRFDRSAASAPQAGSLSASDRLSLGLSANNAAIVGAGVVGRAGPIELLAEWRWDLLVGEGAPPVLESPMHVRAGARFSPARTVPFTIGLLADVSPSNRPDIAPDARLVPIDPRISVMLTAAFRIPIGPRTEPQHSADVASARQHEIVPGSVSGRVLEADGTPLVGARVQIVGRGYSVERPTTEGGHYSLDGVPPGQYELTITAEGHEPIHRTLTITAGQTAANDATLGRALPVGQIRGAAQSFSGERVQATIRIRELNVERTTQPDGSFQIDVAPGSYTITITAPGYRSQTRRVRVEENGVTVLNLDMRSTQ